MVICIYHKRQFIVFSNAQQCYMFRPIRPPTGINVHYFKKQVKFVNSMLEFRRFRKFNNYRNTGILGIL
jgi:hypothetical protein